MGSYDGGYSQPTYLVKLMWAGQTEATFAFVSISNHLCAKDNYQNLEWWEFWVRFRLAGILGRFRNFFLTSGSERGKRTRLELVASVSFRLLWNLGKDGSFRG